METDMKNCVVCGERIPQSAQYCGKCGSGQPTVAEDKRKDAETTTYLNLTRYSFNLPMMNATRSLNFIANTC